MANALSYKTQQETTYGLATVKVGKQAAKVTFLEGGKSFKFSLDDLPPIPKLPTESEDTYMVVLNPDGDMVDKIGPAEGHFTAVFEDFTRSEDGAEPAPQEKTSTYNGKETTYLRFTALFKIVSGRYKGVVVPHFLRYKFAEGDNGETIWDGDPSNPKAIHLPRLVEFCEKLGAVDEPIEWPSDGNILPELLRRIKAANRKVDLVIKKGYIDSVLASDYEDEPVKKSSKKAVKEDDEEEDL